MFRMSLKLFYRSFLINKSTNIINLFGLSTGLAACMLILIFLNNEFNYDKTLKNGDRIVRINTDFEVAEGQGLKVPTTSYPIAAGLAENISSIESFVRFRMSGANRPVYIGQKIFQESHVAWVDSTLFQVFDFDLIKGDPNTCLKAPMSVVLTETTAKKFFGTDDAIGKEVKLRDDRVYNVTGVMEDIPRPSHFPVFSMLFSMNSITIPGAEYWVGRPNYASYLLLGEGHTVEEVQKQVTEVYQTNAKELLELLNTKYDVYIQPLHEIHFDNSFDFQFDFAPQISMTKIYVFSALGFFILVIAVFNFVNMSTARSSERIQQAGISKALGASRNILVNHYIGESISLAVLALIIAYFMMIMVLPFFNDFVGRDIQFIALDNITLLVGFIVLAVVVGLLAGIYPAFFLTSFRPTTTMRGDVFKTKRRSKLRSSLIFMQFTISIALIICTFGVVNQLNYMDNRHPGFNKEQLLVLRVGPNMTKDDCEMFFNEASTLGGVLGGTLSSYLPTMGHMEYTYEVPEEANCEKLMTMRMDVDHRFIDALGLEIIEGRNFDASIPEDYETSVIINETAAKKLGWEHPVGHLLDASPASGEDNYLPVTIIGMVKDINFESLHSEIKPMLLTHSNETPRRIALRLHPDLMQPTIDMLEKMWKQHFATSPFEFSFLDESFNQHYDTEIQLKKLFIFFTVLAIIISATGLFALVSFTTERRTREIGIRKVLGAGTAGIMMMLSKDYIVLVLLANLISWPIAGYAIKKWLESFAYTAPSTWWLYPLAGLVALGLAVMTVLSQTWYTSRINPADTLRHE